MEIVLPIRKRTEVIIHFGHITIFTKPKPKAMVFKNASIFQTSCQANQFFIPLLFNLLQQAIISICILGMWEFIGMVFSIRIGDDYMLFTGCSVFQNPQCLHSLGSTSHDLHKLEFTPNDLVTEDDSFSGFWLMMCLFICCYDLPIFFDFECSGSTICQKITVIGLCLLNSIGAIRECFIFGARNIFAKLIIVIGLDRCNHFTRCIFNQFIGIWKNR